MAKSTNSLSHTKWLCKYHIVIVPKYRRKIIYNQYRKDLQEIIRTFCKYKGVEIIEGHTARTMLANSEFVIMLNQASTDRIKLAELLNISDTQLSYITNVEAGRGLMKVGSALVPFVNKFPKDTKLYKLMTTRPGEQ